MADPGRLDLLDDGLDDETRAAFSAAFHLAEVHIASLMEFRALHQELRLAIDIWHISGSTAGAGSEFAELIGRDHLVLLVADNGQKRIVRAS